MRWVCATVVPWVLAGGLLLSFTASASNDAGSGVSAATRSAVAYLTDAADIVPRITSPAGHMVGLDAGSAILRYIPRYDLPDDERANAIGNPPRSDRKARASGGEPAVNRDLKGQPVIAVRPTISRMAASLRPQLVQGSTRLAFNRDERLLPPTILMPGRPEGPPVEPEGFEPWQAPELTTTRQATSIQSPAAAAAGSTGAAASTTTPAPADMTPVEIAAAPVSRLDPGGMTLARKFDDQPNYVDLIDPDNMNKEQRCLAEAVYFEARGETESGQAAVAQVVLNRVRSGLYPPSICGVVYQNRHRHLACQFTFACEGKALRITESESWESAKRIASAVLEGRTYLAEVGGSTHYHAD
ncbi:MAG: cell wall hydrolase, partial [Microvirga sp.]